MSTHFEGWPWRHPRAFEDDQDVFPSHFPTTVPAHHLVYPGMPLAPFPNATTPVQAPFSLGVDQYGAGPCHPMLDFQGQSNLYPAGDLVLPRLNDSNAFSHQSSYPFAGMYLGDPEAIAAPLPQPAIASVPVMFSDPLQAQRFAQAVSAAQQAYWKNRMARGTLPSTACTQACGSMHGQDYQTNGYHEFSSVPATQADYWENQPSIPLKQENAPTQSETVRYNAVSCEGTMVYVLLANASTTERRCNVPLPGLR